MFIVANRAAKKRMANRVDRDEMAHNKSSHLDLQCLQNCFIWSAGMKGLFCITEVHYENMPIQIYRKFYLQKLKNFR